MAQPQEQKTPQQLPFLLDTLYCEENHHHWDEGVREECFLEEEEEEAESYCSNASKPNHPPLLEPDLSCEDDELASLFSREEVNDIHSKLESDPLMAGSRQEAVEWMLRVNAHYSFSALTAVLAVNYFDRFLPSFDFQGEKPWMTQLAAVACLSIAAKVEETQVPLLLDLQVEETMYVFEAKTIQRMEVLVLSTLLWKMHPVTPLSFLEYITRRFELKNHLCWEFLKRCERVLLSVLSDCRFVSYPPSVIATAVMLHVIDSIEPCIRVQYQSQLVGILGIDKDKVEDCCQLILDVASSAPRGHHHQNKRKFGSTPGSPNGVTDGWFSCDSSNDSWAVAPPAVSSPEPLSKKSRVQEQQHLQTINHETADAPSVVPR